MFSPLPASEGKSKFYSQFRHDSTGHDRRGWKRDPPQGSGLAVQARGRPQGDERAQRGAASPTREWWAPAGSTRLSGEHVTACGERGAGRAGDYRSREISGAGAACGGLFGRRSSLFVWGRAERSVSQGTGLASHLRSVFLGKAGRRRSDCPFQSAHEGRTPGAGPGAGHLPALARAGCALCV